MAVTRWVLAGISSLIVRSAMGGPPNLLDACWSFGHFVRHRFGFGSSTLVSVSRVTVDRRGTPLAADDVDAFAAYERNERPADEPDILWLVPTPPRVNQITLYGAPAAPRTPADTRLPPADHNLPPLPDFTDGPINVQLVHATEEQARSGLARLRRCVGIWRAAPALVVSDNYLLIVTLYQVLHHDSGFQLVFAVEDVFDAPAGFDRTAPFVLGCGWNQPYMSFGPKGVHASFCFDVYFGAKGASRAKLAWATRPAGLEARWMRPALRLAFEGRWPPP